MGSGKPRRVCETHDARRNRSRRAERCAYAEERPLAGLRATASSPDTSHLRRGTLWRPAFR
jgi:hypothetical protein